ncbi:hypothetical protein [uncultured Shewanella sp.]|uniref:hypothetical protein n=1 Tax=uncultured Shewanella sp. TaxID=173975 RepID=UPI0026267D19|nr:hypothetical protein [uncultured Shewanella sp.]
MSEYFFIRESMSIPVHSFPDEFIDSIPLDAFSYPSAPVPLVINYETDEQHSVPDAFEMPAFSLGRRFLKS